MSHFFDLSHSLAMQLTGLRVSLISFSLGPFTT
jgi:hypothetical protein